jgi:hypothetical protein
MALGTAEDQKPARWPDGNRKKGGWGRPQELFDDRFNHSFNGWRQHMGGDSSNPPLSLTDIRTDSNSERALWITVGSRPNRSTAPSILSGNSTAYKNLSLFEQHGLIKFEAWFAVGGTNLDKAPQQVFIGMDTQRYDNGSRGNYRLTNRRYTGNVSTGTLARADTWAITGDTENSVLIPDATTPNGNPFTVGDNENKMNVFHVSLTQDLDAAASSDGKPGGYLEAEINGRKYDLRGLGAGRGKQAPQITSGVGAGSFAGGSNFGIGLNNQTVDNEDGPSWLVVTRARALWYPRLEG